MPDIQGNPLEIEFGRGWSQSILIELERIEIVR